MYGTGTAHSHLMANPTGHFIGAHGVWLWPVAAVAALIVALLALRWLIALLFSTDRSGDLLIRSGSGAGRTILASRGADRRRRGGDRGLPGRGQRRGPG